MSNRASITTGTSSKSRLLAESASYFPLFWLALLTGQNQKDLAKRGDFTIDRAAAIKLGEKHLPFMVSIFPQVALFEQYGQSLLALLSKKRGKVICIDIGELLPHPGDEFFKGMPKLDTAIKTLKNQKDDFTLEVPEREFHNPFIGTTDAIAARTFQSTAEMLLFVCSITEREFKKAKRDTLGDYVVGTLSE